MGIKTAEHVLASMRNAGLLVAEGVAWKARNVRPAVVGLTAPVGGAGLIATEEG